MSGRYRYTMQANRNVMIEQTSQRSGDCMRPQA